MSKTAATPSPATGPLRYGLALILTLLGAGGIAAAWTLAALALDRQCAWMAILAAVDAIFLLRLAQAPAGTWRAIAAVGATLLSIAVANWWIAGAQMGQMLGLPPWAAIARLGWSHGQTLLALANDATDLAWYGLSLGVALWGGRR